ncbi:MAG: acetylxylan esterase, partial [Bacteroidota bacterium]
MKATLLIPLLLCCATLWLPAQISVQTDRADAVYAAGDRMNFVLTTSAGGDVQYFIRFDNRSSVIESGVVKAATAGTYHIPFTLDEPGFVNCFVVQGGNTDNAAAAFSPFDIDAYEEEPSDFDAFWASAKSTLASIPMDPVVTPHSSSTYSDTYRVNLANIDNRRVYGYLSVPKGTGPFPAILILPSFGSAPNHVTPQPFIAEQGNALSFAINIHNAEPDASDPMAYQRNQIDNRDQVYYKQALLGAVRAIDYLFSRPDFDGEHLGVTGVSQGGGLSACTAGLDDRVRMLVMSISALCQHTGLKYDRPSGHPHYLFTASFTPELDEATTNEAIKYYDAAYFLRRFKGPSMTFVGYEDDTCPPGTILAAFNQLQGPKTIQHVRDRGHDAPDYFTERFDFFRTHFAAMRTPPSPFVEVTTSYVIDAGMDQKGTVASTFSLSANVSKNELPIANPSISWQKIDGPGSVLLSQPNQLSTTAQFSEPGTYRLRLTVHDQSDLSAEGEWYSSMDDVLIVVE